MKLVPTKKLIGSFFFNTFPIVKNIFTICFLLIMFTSKAQNPGDRAQKFRGTWWGGVHTTLLDDKLLSLRTIDGWGVGFTSGASQSALHYAPVPYLLNLAGADAVFPASNDTSVRDNIAKIKNAGFMVQAYTNSENFTGVNASQFEEFADSWREWCDTNPDAQAFINSQSYHTKAGFPDRPYMFCYAEFVLKYYSEQYGKDIDIWVFDDGHTMEEQGDDALSGNIDDQRLYLAYANAARAGNDAIAVAFNNGRSTVNYNSYPFAHAVWGDDFTFGHAFGGNNNHAEKVNGSQFNSNYQHIARMTETNGYAHAGGDRTWDDNIVAHFFSKLSTTAWNFGPNQAWEQDDFNEWHEEALSAGGMLTWSGSYNRQITGYYDWVYPMLKATDDYLYERGISINGEQTTNPVVTPPVNPEVPVTPTTNFTPDPNKKYYIDVPVHNLRLAANGSSEDTYTTATSTTGADVEWKFVANGDGAWFIDRVAGGTLPRLRTDQTEFADMQADSFDGAWESFTISDGDSNGTFFLTTGSNSEFTRLQVDRNGEALMVATNRNGTWESFRFTEAGSINEDTTTSDGIVVHITKRNATGFALDGGHGGENAQNIYLWEENQSNVNQQWIEIDRGNGYYSYQKMGTEHCIDGGAPGASNEQNVYLWTCSNNNQNQQWQKVEAGGGAVKLVKRNDSGFAINGGGSGANEQNVNLFDSSNSSRNLQWFVTPIGSEKSINETVDNDRLKIYPNPVADVVTVSLNDDKVTGKITYKISDLSGRSLGRKTTTEKVQEFYLNSLAPAIYVLEVDCGLKKYVRKIVKE